MDYKKLLKQISFITEAHQEKALTEKKTTRTFQSGESNPFFIHPVWCALTILQETKLPESVRLSGAETLLFHDILKDTSAELPEDLPQEIKNFIQEMTFSDFQTEIATIPTKPPFIQLLKLYDKTATLYDGAVKEKTTQEWYNYIQKLIDNVGKEYGELNIVLLAKTLLANK
jgi:hypothetical protein